MKRKRIAVAMSGGLDSSVAAALLVDKGAEVVGLTARMWAEGSRCCSKEDIDRARRVCRSLGIRHVVINALDVFQRCIVDRFAAEYVRGRTPSPCVVCNQVVKFGLLLTRAVQFGCERMATGHYARLHQEDGAWTLWKARDGSRDQSYFLHRLSQRQLAHACFPLGDMIKKADVADYADRRGLPLQERTESRDLCFVPDGGYAEFVEEMFPGANRPGPIHDPSDRRIGTHAGLHRYTVGQRKGLGIAAGEPRYVTGIDVSRNVVTLGTREEALAHTCTVEDARWIAGDPPPEEAAYTVRIRYRHEGARARYHSVPDGRLRVEFTEPQFAVTPGQAAVFYDGDRVLGGGWIGEKSDEIST